jgi:hypothetical protein
VTIASYSFILSLLFRRHHQILSARQQPDYQNHLHLTTTTNAFFRSLGNGRSLPRLPSFELSLIHDIHSSYRYRLRARHPIFSQTTTPCSPLTRVSALRVVFNPAHWCLRVKDSASQYAAVILTVAYTLFADLPNTLPRRSHTGVCGSKTQQANIQLCTSVSAGHCDAVSLARCHGFCATKTQQTVPISSTRCPGGCGSKIQQVRDQPLLVSSLHQRPLTQNKVSINTR